MVSRSNIKQQITKPGDIKMPTSVAKQIIRGAKKVRDAVRSAKHKGPKKKKKVIKKNMGGGLSPNKAKELNNIMNASQGIAENLQKQSMVSRKRGGIIDGNDLVSSYYE